ncbi:MAG: exopolysaccharide Pel transporter PelG [Clostridia bacterium]|nr:exopolysaccharide Pel transporter PelG [Clostridia bacterium]
MAGIGFELKKLFVGKGILNSARAYGYTLIICAGPMLLGILMLLGITGICSAAGVSTARRELLTCMITYTLLASTMSTAFFSMVVTRFVSDMLYEDKSYAGLTSFWGSSVVMLVPGCLLYGAFICISGMTLLQGFLSLIFYGELILTWNSMTYLSAIKDYKGIFRSYVTAIAAVFLLGALLLHLDVPAIEAMLFSLTVGYGIMFVWNVSLLYGYFPQGGEGAFMFLRWVDTFMPLALTGLFVNVGMMIHIIMMWFSDVGEHMGGLMYSAPYYDVPAFIAYLTTLITTVNFMVSVEVNFYPKYRNHYSLYNDKGTISDIKQAEREMLHVLRVELFYTALKQLLFTVVCIALGGALLSMLPLGFNEIMRGYFRTLCVAYGVYAIGNTVMLIMLYFTDYVGALIATAVFSVSSILFTAISMLFPSVYYGFGFLIASVLFVIVCLIRLDYFTKRLPYYILSVQSLTPENNRGVFSRLGEFLEKRLERKSK